MAQVKKKAVKPKDAPAAPAPTKDLRVEHVLAALDQITALSAHVRTALEGMDPKTVVRSIRAKVGGPPSPLPLGHCDVNDPSAMKE
jgi:hypothetical protein